MRAKKTLILGSMLLALALAGCGSGKCEMDEKTIDSLSTQIADKLDPGDEFVTTVGDKLVKKVDTELVKKVVDTVVAENEEWAPIPISEATGSWKVWQTRIESKQMTEAQCEGLSGCELGTCQTPIEELTGFKVVELKPTGDDPAVFNVEDPQYGVGAEPTVTIENNTVTISNKFIAVHDKLCKEGQTGIPAQRECEVWEMVTQHRFTLAAHNMCTVTVTTGADEPFASGTSLEEAEQKLGECQSSLEGAEGQGGECSFQADVTFKAGALECLAQTDDFDTYKEWLEQDTGYKMYVDRGGAARRARVPDEVECK